MKLLLTNANIVDAQSAFHTKKCDILINNGFIEDIQPSSKKAFPSTLKSFDCKGASVSPGWADMRAALREPGFEFKEDLASAAQTAVAGGYTIITCLPSTQPPIQSKADIEFVYRKAESLPVHILPYGALSKNRDGVDMNELYDMHKAGAVAFTDANKPVSDAGLMLRALQYSNIFGGLVMSHPDDTSLSTGGRMHEGPMSTSLGLKGIPPISEELMVVRDIELAKYADAPVHIAHVSTKGSVELIRKAKKQGLRITCDVAVANLCFLDEHLSSFDSNYKLTPPLRGKTDQKALWDGLIDGTIDCIVSDHHPEDIEHKQVEYEYAAQGMIMLQTTYSLLTQYAPKGFTEEILVNALAVRPRTILKQPLKIAKGAKAELTLFDAKQTWNYSDTNNLSRSKNSPVLNTTLTGKVLGVVTKDQFFKTI
ncbi:MAG: dihydroorotase [Bacteroidota bacterium]